MTNNKNIAIQIVVLNGEKYIGHCLESVFEQSYPKENIELIIWDNGSTDKTKELIDSFEFRISNLGFAKFSFMKSKENLGMWPAQEELLKNTSAPYILVLAVDVILDKDFISNTIKVFESDSQIGAIQPKVFKYDIPQLTASGKLNTDIIDTGGFQISRSRRVTNIGHGESDGPKFSEQKEVFAVEGACPVFRRSALESVKIKGEIIDKEYFWYGDDLDLGWRLTLFGWRQIFSPKIIAWHDRQTTKNLKVNWIDYLKRIPERSTIPILKRRLDWRNVRFTIVKNDYIINLLTDSLHILAREILVFFYAVFFEPKVLLEIPNLFKKLPGMMDKRKEIMRKARVSPKEMRRWFK